MGRLIGVLFFGAFALAGIGFFFYSAVPMISGWASAKSWEPVQAELIQHKLETSYGDDSTTYKATAEYRYRFQGQSYRASKVGFSGGSDNIGSYHQDMDRKLSRVKRGAEPLTVWVNPVNPAEAVIDRGVRWGLLGFKSIFLLLFGGFGLGGLYVMYRFRKLGEVLPDADPSRPWTQYAEWNSATLLSNAKLGNIGMLCFALFWNLISWPTTILALGSIADGDYLVLLVLIFPVVGTYLAWIWYKGHRSYRRTGPMPLELDPYPGSIGGQVGGIIHCANAGVGNLMGMEKTAKVTIENVHHYETGSGDNRRTKEHVLFESAMVPSIEPGQGGLEVRFCFDLHSDLPVSQPPLDLPRKVWRIRFHAVTNDGLEIEREYDDVPVFATKQQSAIKDAQAYAAMSTATLDAKEQLVESVLDFKPDERGQKLFYPAFRNQSMLFLVAIGLVFLGIGLAIPSLIFNIVFPLIGGILTLGGIYSFANSLEVRVGAEGITSKRRLFGYNFQPQFVPSYSFKHFKKKESSSSSSGKKTTTYYKIIAHGNEGEKAVVAEGLVGLQEAEAAIEKLNSLVKGDA